MQGDDPNEMRRTRLLNGAVGEQVEKLFRLMSKHQALWGTVVMKSLPEGRYEFYNGAGELVDVFVAWSTEGTASKAGKL